MERTTKICCNCKQEKIVPDEFAVDKRTRDGCAERCKMCVSKRVCKWQSDHPEKYLDNRRRAAYKIDFNILWEEQKGLCAVCGDPMLPFGKQSMSVTIDHDRKCCPGYGSCGKCVRGLIHSKCNRVIGNALDDIDLLKSAAVYLEKWQNKKTT